VPRLEHQCPEIVAVKWVASVLLIAAVAAAGFYLEYKGKYPDYGYRYRLQLSVEVDGRIHTGSSVIDVLWRGGPNLEARGIYNAQGFLRGQAPIVDLGDRGIIVVSLVNGNLSGPAAGVSALFLCTKAFNSVRSFEDFPNLSQMKGRRDLDPNNWPRLLWLPERSNPNRVVNLARRDLEAVVGGGARFVEAFVEITDDPVVVDIEQRLPWFRAWRDQILRKGPLLAGPNDAILSPLMLERDGS
jgi:hypothetical protein